MAQERPAARLSKPVIEVDLEAAIAEVRAGDAFRGSDHAAQTLVKEAGLDVVLLVLKAGGHVREHRAHVPILVQVLEGSLRFFVEGREVELRPGRMLAVDAGLPHRLEATEAAAVLLTLG